MLAVALIMAACAGAAPPHAAVQRSAPAAAAAATPVRAANADARFRELFDSTCLTCHSATEPPMPDFTHEMSPELLALALNRVTAREMPPPGVPGLDPLSDDDREQLVFGLCRKTTRSEDECREVATDVVRPDLMRPGSVVAKMMAKNAPSPLPDGVRDLLTSADSAGTPYSLKRPGTVAAVVLAALHACRPEAPKADAEGPTAPASKPAPTETTSGKPAPKTAEERRQCVEQLLRASLKKPVPAR